MPRRCCLLQTKRRDDETKPQVATCSARSLRIRMWCRITHLKRWCLPPPSLPKTAFSRPTDFQIFSAFICHGSCSDGCYASRSTVNSLSQKRSIPILSTNVLTPSLEPTLINPASRPAGIRAFSKSAVASWL